MTVEWEISEEMLEQVEREYESIIARSTLDKYIHNPVIKARFIEVLWLNELVHLNRIKYS